MSQTNPTTAEATSEALVKKIPVLGQVYAVTEGVGAILAKAFPGVFNTSAGIQAQAAAKFDQGFYNTYKDQKYFAMMFDDPDFTVPTVVLNGIHPMLVFSEDRYNQGVSDGSFVNGMTTRPLDKGKYLLFPNIVKAYVQDQINQANAIQQQTAATQATVQAEQAKYGELLPIVNWFKTDPTMQAISSNVESATDKAIATQTTWMPWALGALAVFGGLSLVYIVLED